MAGGSKVVIKVKGKGGHGSEPAYSIDPITAATFIHSALHTVKSRKVFNSDVLAFTICSIASGTANNVIPDEAIIQGTIRYLSVEARDKLEKFISKITLKTAEAHECTAEVSFAHFFDPTINHDIQTEIVYNIVKSQLGESMLDTTKGLPVMASEDFSFYLNLIPGCFFFLNNNQEGKAPLSLHDCNYYIYLLFGT